VSDNTVVFSTLLAEQIRAHGYKVFLTGEGGDEIFLGYPWWVKLIKWQKSLQTWGGVARWGLPLLPARYRRRAVGRMWRRARRGSAEIYWDSQLGLPGETRGPLQNGRAPVSDDAFLERTRAEFRDQGGACESQWFTYLDLNLRLPEMLLLRLDRAAMLSSTEARSPLLEKRLVELSLAMPEQIKLGRGRPKGAFLQAMRKIVPSELVIRRKVGYNQSLASQLPNLSHVMKEVLLRWNRQAGPFRQDRLEGLAAAASPEVLWPLYALSEWHRSTFLRGRDG
jgi:asparagine synthase (glutamine-hydrolysing)